MLSSSRSEDSSKYVHSDRPGLTMWYFEVSSDGVVSLEMYSTNGASISQPFSVIAKGVVFPSTHLL